MSGVINQDELLEAADQKIKQCGYYIRESLKSDDMRTTIDRAAELVDQLRLNIHSPKSYYNIYISITDELRKVEAYLTDEFSRGERIEDLYEIVQYNPYVLPRLYMMITVGVVYLNVGIFPPQELLRDMTEMCRGVQHPMRGMFLRNYLLQTVKKNLLSFEPTDETAKIGKPEEFMDPIQFILTNFCEMNKLWVQLQYRGHSREQATREQERKELKLLVGTNILRLSQLPKLTVDVYAERILPFICHQLLSCRDSLAQEYLFECVIQAFPDTFHIHTFERLMSTLMALHENVNNVDSLMASLTDRLGRFSHTEEGNQLFKEHDMVNKCIEHARRIIQDSKCVARNEAIGLYGCVLQMALKANIETLQKLTVASSMGNAVEEYLKTGNCTRIVVKSPLGGQLLTFLRLYVSPDASTNLDSAEVLNLLRLDCIPLLLDRMELAGQVSVVTGILEALHGRNIMLTKAADALMVLGLLDSLICYPWMTGSDSISTTDQQLLGSFPHLFKLTGESADTELEVFSKVLHKLEVCGARQLVYRLPPFVSSVLRAVKLRQKTDDKNLEKYYETMIMDFAYPSITLLFNEHIEVALNLLISGALVAGSINFEKSESCAYELITQAFALFEDGIAESYKQVNALTLIFGAVQRMHCFSDADQTFSSLRKRLTQASKLLIKRPDQCRLLILSSNLYWEVKKKDDSTMIYDYQNAFDILSRARRVAGSCIDHATQAQLLLDIIDQYIYFADQPVAKSVIPREALPVNVIQEMLTSVSNLLVSSRQKDMSSQLMSRAMTILRYLRQCESMGPHFISFSVEF